jgi:hypothetical protein
VNYLPRFGDTALKFLPLADDFCDEMNVHPCFAAMKPSSFRVSLTIPSLNSQQAINGFTTVFQERVGGNITNSWTCRYGQESKNDTIVELKPTYGAFVQSLTFSLGLGLQICGVTIKMDSGEVLKAGPCSGDLSLVTDSKTYEFNQNTNLFLSVGGIPSTGWQVVGIQGIKQFFTMTL